tara:strand:- start:1396 stop:2823 length:1428 start_codon:yes stop_codon:yes gene_type:complete
MAVKFSNNAVTTLSAGISAGVTQFAVASNTGFPTLSGSDYTYVTIGSEVVKVTAISGTTWTCVATSSSHTNGDNVELRMTAELLNDFATDLEAMPKTGGTFTGNVSLNDNVLLGLGDNSSSGSDLILYHDGTNAYINTSTGALRLSTAVVGSSVQILGSGETLAEFSDDGDVDLFYNGAVKFSTTNTGVNVVGNIALSGTVDGRDIDADGTQLDANTTAIALNTAKTGITSGQASAITANTAKVGITSSQATAISDNTAKTGITSSQATAIVNNTAKVGITTGQASAIVTNTAKVGITSSQASAITANTAKVGITTTQADAIVANTAKTGITSGQASAITANTAKVTNATHTGDVTGATALTISAGAVDIAMLSATGTAGSGNFLRGDNSWAVVDGLPSQTGNAGKFLTTDATNASWAVLNTDSNTTTKGLYEMANTISANYSITSGNNAMTAGPITINSGISVTVPSGSTWVIA